MERERLNSQPDQAEGVPDAEKNKKFLNGWTKELDELMAEWSDKAACYRWMHERTEKEYGAKNNALMIPVIILSTLTGTANFGLASIFGDDQVLQHYATLAIGGVSLIAGIITTLANFLRYAQGSEAHHQAALSWGKFNRLITVELKLNPIERMDSMNFLKMCRVELDRLIEQSPPIPDSIIEKFRRQFAHATDVKKPEIADGIEHTVPFKDSNARLKRIAAEAAIMLHHKKGVIKQMVMSDIDMRIAREGKKMEQELISTIEAIAHKVVRDATRGGIAPKDGLQEPRSPKAPSASTGMPKVPALEVRKELQELNRKGVVAALRNQFTVNTETPNNMRLVIANGPSTPIIPTHIYPMTQPDGSPFPEPTLVQIVRAASPLSTRSETAASTPLLTPQTHAPLSPAPQTPAAQSLAPLSPILPVPVVEIQEDQPEENFVIEVALPEETRPTEDV